MSVKKRRRGPPKASLPPLHRCLPSPARLYLLFLVVVEKLTNEEIRATAALDALEAGGDEYLDSLRAAVLASPASRLKKKASLHTHYATLGISGLVERDEASLQAFSILRNPRCRELTEALLIAGAPSKTISATASRLSGLTLTEEGVRAYHDLFFSIRAFSRAELKIMLEGRVQREADRLAGDDAQARRGIVRALRGDARHVALQSPASPLAVTSVLIRAGVLPARLDLRGVIEVAQSTAAVRMVEALHRAGPEDDRRANAYASITRQASDLLDGMASPGTDLVDQFVRFQIAQDERPRVLLADLTGGNHSSDPHSTVEPLANDAEG